MDINGQFPHGDEIYPDAEEDGVPEGYTPQEWQDHVEYGENLDYGNGFHDGMHGNERRSDGFFQSETHYRNGFAAGRKELIRCYHRYLETEYPELQKGLRHS